MEYSLNLILEQKLVMTQQMQLSIKLLQMSTFELQQYVDKELVENPVLEVEVDAKPTEQVVTKIDYKELIKYLDDQNDLGKYSKQDFDEDVSPLNFVVQTISLRGYLIEQLLEINADKYDRIICEYLIESIDERGYLDCSLDDICKELNIYKIRAVRALEILQSLEPAGIGARDLKECLKVQLKRKNILEGNIISVIDNYLECIGQHKYSIIAKALKITLSEVQEICDIIKSLEPKPSRGYFTGESTEFVVPDAYITKIDGEYMILMNEEAAPRLKINSIYKEIIMNEKDKNTVDYVKDKINSAIFLINSIEKRKSTIYRILEKIIEIQKQYFKYGEKYLKPMTLKNIADAIEVHESTASRAIKGKYISTDFGVVQIKKLFTKGMTQETSTEDISTNMIKNRIEELILEENKMKPLSDQKLCEILNEEGINVARRTVAKYREELEIMPSSKRKRF